MKTFLLVLLFGSLAHGQASTAGVYRGSGLTNGELRAAPVVVSGAVTALGGLTNAELRASPVPVSNASLPLPTGASTESTLSTLNSKVTAVNTGAVVVSSSVLPSGASTSVLQTSGNASLSSIDGKLPSGLTVTTGRLQVELPSGGGGLTDSELRASSVPVTLSDMTVDGQAAQTAIVANILTTTSGAAATDLIGFKSATVQVVSTGTAGTFIFEGSNDNVNFQSIPVFIQSTSTGAPLVVAITATNSQFIYTFPVQARYIRLRIVTTITGGSIRAFSRFSQATWTPAFFQAVQNTAGSLATSATIASGTVTTVSTLTSMTSGNLAIPGIIADVASAALTTTTTTATLTPTFGPSYKVVIPVTVVSGTNPTLDVQIQESDNTGTNWVPIYDFPRITATGLYRSPMFPLTGNRVRYVQTVGGTTPSFTRSISRLQSSLTDSTTYRQIIDRTISLNTLDSVTPNLTVSNGKNAQIVVNIGAATVAPILQIEGSDDNGSTWYPVGSTLLAVANSTVQLTVPGMISQLLRVRVQTAGSGVTAGYTLLRAF